jgi:hypothetical protein
MRGVTLDRKWTFGLGEKRQGGHERIMTEDLDGARSIPELCKQAGMLPDVIETELLGMFRSSEF